MWGKLNHILCFKYFKYRDPKIFYHEIVAQFSRWYAHQLSHIRIKYQLDDKVFCKSTKVFNTCLIFSLKQFILGIFMLFPAGIEPATFRICGERDNHDTTKTSLILMGGLLYLSILPYFNKLNMCSNLKGIIMFVFKSISEN